MIADPAPPPRTVAEILELPDAALNQWLVVLLVLGGVRAWVRENEDDIEARLASFGLGHSDLRNLLDLLTTRTDVRAVRLLAREES